MSSTLEVPTVSAVTETELYVIWRQPTTHSMIPVGVLTFDGDTYAFRYLPDVADVEEFRPLLGFRDLKKRYTSHELFPLFQERVLDPTRPDFARVLSELSLDPTATPWEQLVHSGGSSEGDTLRVTPFPREHSSGWACTALAAGVRYLAMKTVTPESGRIFSYSDAELEAVLGRLTPGQSLRVVAEPKNTYSAVAQLLTTEQGEPVGYVPDWIARLTAPRLQDGTAVQAFVDRINGPRAGWHLRLLVTIHVDEPFADLRRRLVTSRSNR